LHIYTIDHLKRHWVKPQVKKESVLNSLKEEFEKIDENNPQRKSCLSKFKLGAKY